MLINKFKEDFDSCKRISIHIDVCKNVKHSSLEIQISPLNMCNLHSQALTPNLNMLLQEYSLKVHWALVP
jgi:hypothetical protein